MPTTAPEVPANSSSHATDVAASVGGDADITWWKPAPGTSYQIQLNGKLDLTREVKMYDIDLYDTDAKVISNLKAKGIKVVCYFSAGTYENWRSDNNKFTKDMYSKGLPEWEGEYWLDTRNAKVREIMKARIQLAKQKGCDGVDPDNVDAAFNDSGFPLTGATQLDYNKFLASTAHSLGLAVGLKNDLQQVAALASVFDFAVNEQCAAYNECKTLQPFIKLNKAVFGIEYDGDKTKVCKASNALNMDTLFKDLSLKSEYYSCREHA
uniref:Glycoside-hydrolase family GH114 TIM-barrel domain-containing protein n=1 Tax=Globisporangium ultimum (strain ATCC 200006 / CBS 805.95 / DAOM BR144) TaxID=431595 RepID=K3X8A1_GLOUD